MMYPKHFTSCGQNFALLGLSVKPTKRNTCKALRLNGDGPGIRKQQDMDHMSDQTNTRTIMCERDVHKASEGPWRTGYSKWEPSKTYLPFGVKTTTQGIRFLTRYLVIGALNVKDGHVSPAFRIIDASSISGMAMCLASSTC